MGWLIFGTDFHWWLLGPFLNANPTVHSKPGAEFNPDADSSDLSHNRVALLPRCPGQLGMTVVPGPLQGSEDLDYLQIVDFLT